MVIFNINKYVYLLIKKLNFFSLFSFLSLLLKSSPMSQYDVFETIVRDEFNQIFVSHPRSGRGSPQ